jgi:hypothetical protein
MFLAIKRFVYRHKRAKQEDKFVLIKEDSDNKFTRVDARTLRALEVRRKIVPAVMLKAFVCRYLSALTRYVALNEPQRWARHIFCLAMITTGEC